MGVMKWLKRIWAVMVVLAVLTFLGMVSTCVYVVTA